MDSVRNIRRTSWSDLSLDLLRYIAKFLRKNIDDLCTFRLVCKNWRRSTFISQYLPLHEIITSSDNLFSSSVYLLHSHSAGEGDASANANAAPWMVCAVEITKGNIQLCHPFTLTPYWGLDITQFRQTLLTESYHIAAIRDIDCSSALSDSDKVLLCSKKLLPKISDCSVLVLLNGRLGGVPSLKRDQRNCVDVSHVGGVVDEFDDIVSFKGVVYALDCQGKLYEISPCKVAVQKILIDQPLSYAAAYAGRRMRLVGSYSDDELYLLVRKQDIMKVYCLAKSYDSRSWSWVQVKGFLVDDQVLFVAKNFCFFASASVFFRCKLNNCIIFSEDAFPLYGLWGWKSHRKIKDQEGIWIVQLKGQGSHKCQSILSFPDFPINLWTPPQSVLQAHALRRGSLFEEHIQHSEIRNKAASVLPCLQFDNQMQDLKCTDCYNSKVDFEGVYIRSDLVPTLQKVWMKHGNIVEGSSVHSKDMLACSLESLAKVIIILQSSSGTGRTLSKSQCDYINSVLMDLLQVRFKVEWLVPFVEKARMLYQNKPLIDGLAEVDKNIARAEEMKVKYIKELASLEEMQKELMEDRTMLLERIPIEKHDYLHQCIEEGLF